ncbi:MAG: oligopeptide/dipeptide ABC transporter ATP-binding protein [Thermodesulfobacteriota bacterium]
MDWLIRTVGLTKYFPLKKGLFRRPAGWFRAVDGVDLTIARNKVLGLVGESGCGKTTLGRTILRLQEPTAGQVFFNGVDLLKAGPGELRRLRARMQIIFQDPSASLNPRMRVGTIIRRNLDIHPERYGRNKKARVLELLEMMGLLPEHYGRFPHELSGGQRQRVGIARALAVDPEFVVLDEPTSSLDVSVQAQILNLLRRLQVDFHLTCLFISHDLRVINHICDQVAVMYAGRIVEAAGRETLFASPRHPYTRLLFSSIPEIGRKAKNKLISVRDEPPGPASTLSGCRFHPRCPERIDGCDRIEPRLAPVGPAHFSACLRHGRSNLEDVSSEHQ